jgi:hypothetical protein
MTGQLLDGDKQPVSDAALTVESISFARKCSVSGGVLYSERCDPARDIESHSAEVRTDWNGGFSAPVIGYFGASSFILIKLEPRGSGAVTIELGRNGTLASWDGSAYQPFAAQRSQAKP